jgi:hypothetical protein
LDNKATAIITTARQKCVFFQFLKVKKLVKAPPKTVNLVEIAVKKHIFPQFSQKRIFHFAKCCSKNYAAAGQEHKTSTFAQLCFKTQLPIFIMFIQGFSFTFVETLCTNAHSQLLIPLKAVIHITTC